MAARHVLTDKQIEKAKAAPQGQRSMLWDALIPSLALRITDKGHKTFVIQRRVKGRMVKLTLGEYPALGLAKARENARNALSEMTRGIDPRQSQTPRVTSSGLRRDSFEAAVESYIKREVEKNRRPRTQDEIVRPLRKLIPQWGTLPLSEIGPQEILSVLDEIVDAGTPVAANRTYSVLRRFFGWCIERRLLQTNPAAVVRKPSKEESRSRVLDDDELRLIWTASDGLGWPFGPLVRGLILTGQRRNELAGACWSEFNFDRGEWTIPATRTKNGKEHLVPLSEQMLLVFEDAPHFANGGGTEDSEVLVFTTTGKTPISGFSRAKTKLDSEIARLRQDDAARQRRSSQKVKPLPDWTFHDLRRSCATGMGRLGIQPHIIETVLNHSGGFRSGIAGVYQRHPYLEERRRALEMWAHHVCGLSERASKNVLPFPRAAT
jgi:integrase